VRVRGGRRPDVGGGDGRPTPGSTRGNRQRWRRKNKNPFLSYTYSHSPAPDAGCERLVRNLQSLEAAHPASENTMVIFMDEYRKAKALDVAASRQYDEALLCVNWNPAIGAVAMSSYQTPQELSPSLPEDFSNTPVEAFLDRVYALATQI
jgi:hypothetical protein